MLRNTTRDRDPSLRPNISESARVGLETATSAKDRFLHLVNEKPDEIVFADLPPGKVSVAAPKDLSPDGLERLFEGDLTQKK